MITSALYSAEMFNFNFFNFSFFTLKVAIGCVTRYEPQHHFGFIIAPGFGRIYFDLSDVMHMEGRPPAISWNGATVRVRFVDNILPRMHCTTIPLFTALSVQWMEWGSMRF